MTFDKEALFSMFQPKVVPISVEHDGTTMELFARELSADQVFRLQDKQKAQKKGDQDNEGFTISLLSQSLCDESGKLVLSEAEAKRLAGMQVGAFNKVAKAVAEAVGLSPTTTEVVPAKPNGEDTAGN